MKGASPLEAIARGRILLNEDLLTSLVLGRFARTPELLCSLVRLAIPHLDAPELRAVDIEHLEFWRWWPASHPGVPGCEPDAEVVLVDDQGRRQLLAIEAKLGAEKSGLGDRDQLMRQVACGHARARRLRAELAGVLFLTADSCLPHRALEASMTAIHKLDVPPAGLYWQSWSTCYALLDGSPGDRDAQDDAILRVLARAGQVGFCGWSATPGPLGWTFADWSFEAPRAPEWRFADAVTLPPASMPAWRFDQ